ncbi:MAG: hypothetical protein WBB27_10160 [Maribacter sp.]
MKTLILLLLAPTLVLTQMNEKIIPDQIDVQFWLDIQPTASSQSMQGTVEYSVTLEFFMIDYSPNPKSVETKNSIPRHLTTYSLTTWHPSDKKVNTPNDELNRLIAMNDFMFPKENTLNKSFGPVKHTNFKPQYTQNVNLGFGPRILL